MHQSKYLFLACVILLAGWSLFWIGEQVSETNARVAAAAPAATATAAPKGGAMAGSSLPGKPLFQQNCAACHAINKDMTGPALAGVTGRGPWADRKQLYAWVHNPPAFMAKDPYTKGLQKQFGAIMAPFPQLSEKDIDQIVEYIETAGKS